MARYIKAQGKREARRPGFYHEHPRSRPERPKYAGNYVLSGLERFNCLLPGATRFALAPGSHIPRRWRSIRTLRQSSQKGFITTFEVERTISFVGKFKLDCPCTAIKFQPCVERARPQRSNARS